MIEPSKIIQKMYSLSEEDVLLLQKKFTTPTHLPNDLFLGQLSNQVPTMIIGTPCPRKCIEGISLNTFYQILIPLKVANKLKIPCKIFLGIKEEIISQPYYAKDFRILGIQLEKGIRNLADHLNVDVQIINTLNPEYDQLVDSCVNEIPINLSAQDSSYLFSLSTKKVSRTLHSVQRVGAEKRSLACNSNYLLEKLFGKQSFLMVEDVEQYGPIVHARNFGSEPFPNMLAFMPLPSIKGTTNMFKAQKNERVLLFQKQDYYKNVFNTAPIWVREIYNNVLSLADTEFIALDPTASLTKISNYFK